MITNHSLLNGLMRKVTPAQYLHRRNWTKLFVCMKSTKTLSSTSMFFLMSQRDQACHVLEKIETCIAEGHEGGASCMCTMDILIKPRDSPGKRCVQYALIVSGAWVDRGLNAHGAKSLFTSDAISSFNMHVAHK